MTRGEWGEAQASELLLHRGCRIVARNFRTRYGELDIIAEHGEYLLFVEVKTRKNNHFASAREAVGPKKQEKLRLTAGLWLQEHPSRLQPRFDVIEVYGEPGGRAEMVQLENAF